MIELTQKERNELVRDNLDETISKLSNHRQGIRSMIKKKDTWTKIDALFPSYYERYIQFLNTFAIDRTKSKKLNKEENNTFSFISFMFRVVIYAYLTEKLNEPVVLRRYAELGLLTLELHKKRNRKQKEITKSLESLCPIETQDAVALTN
ncbi:MAG: hypothetical protein ACYDDC_00340 [Thermoplasmataceae archaeon]